jgi:NAD(P)-dependent dehydrogenase (short-subunit alcohol dehydrogenase family)
LTHSATASIEGKTILITGATRGIGFATAAALAGMNADVIVHGRDPARVEKACADIRRSSTGSHVSSVVADLGSLAEVRQLASDIRATTDRLDVLINNAGLVTRKRELTVDGLERQLAVNHLAPFLLTNLLLGMLESSAPARIVNVSSMAHRRAGFDLDDLNWEQRRYSGIGAYGATKLANILFTRELARRLEGTGVTANCLHPGVVATHIFSGMGMLGALFGILAKPLLMSSRRGARTSVFVASSADVAGVSGEFFDECKVVDPARAALEAADARSLWERSERLSGLGGNAHRQ